MNAITTKKWTLEGLWLLFTMIIAIIVLLPIYLTVPDYPYYFFNILYIFIAIQMTRYIFALKYTPFSHSLWFKLIIIFTAIPVIVLLTDGMAEFQADWDEGLFTNFLDHLSPKKINNISKYIKTEFMLFGVSSVICAIVMPIRMIISIWRVRNRNSV